MAEPWFATLIALALWSSRTAPHAFDLQGHRGTRGLAPENTLVAFQRALALGVTTLETDLAVTKDGVLVIAHDPLLNPDLVRGPDGKWLPSKGPAIHSLTLEQLRGYDVGRTNPASAYGKQYPEQQPADGQRFPTLKEVFALGAGNNVRFAIETKITPTSGSDTPDPATFAKLVVDAVREAGMSRARRGAVVRLAHAGRGEEARAGDTRPCASRSRPPNFDNVKGHFGTVSVDGGSRPRRATTARVPRLVRAAGCNTWSSFFRNLTPATHRGRRRRSGSRCCRGR